MRDRGFVPRLLLARDLRENDEAPLSPAQTHYLRRVLRLREGDAARVFDGEGAEREAIIVAGKRAWNLKIGAAAASADARFPVVVAQIAGGGARGDWAVEKMCEIGVAAFAPLYRQKPPREAALARWRRIVAAACAQCGRAKLMRIERPQTFAEWIARVGDDAEARFLLTPEVETPLLIAGAQNDCCEQNAAGMRFGDAVARRRGRLFAGRKTKRARKRIRLRRVGRARFALRNRAGNRRRVVARANRNRARNGYGEKSPRRRLAAFFFRAQFGEKIVNFRRRQCRATVFVVDQHRRRLVASAEALGSEKSEHSVRARFPEFDSERFAQFGRRLFRARERARQASADAKGAPPDRAQMIHIVKSGDLERAHRRHADDLRHRFDRLVRKPALFFLRDAQSRHNRRCPLRGRIFRRFALDRGERFGATAPPAFARRSSVDLAENDIHRADNRDRVGNHMAARHLVHRRQMREARGADFQAVGLVRAV